MDITLRQERKLSAGVFVPALFMRRCDHLGGNTVIGKKVLLVEIHGLPNHPGRSLVTNTTTTK
jgi:hypothetical protein